MLAAVELSAATASRDAFVPVAGRSTGAGGRGFYTTVWVTNVAEEHATVTLSFLGASQPNPKPLTYTQRLAPGEVRQLALPEHLLHGTSGIGALRVESTADVIASAHVYSLLAGESEARATGATFEAIPARSAFGSGESTVVPGVATPGARFKLYVVETTGHPLYFTLARLDARGRVLSRQRHYVGIREARAYDLASDGAVAVRIEGMNGSGKLVAAGVALPAESQDATVFTMSVPLAPRHRLPMGEMAAYALIALALVGAAFRRR